MKSATLSFLAVAAASTSEDSLMSSLFDDLPANPTEAKKEGLKRISAFMDKYESETPNGMGSPSEYPYFNFFPQYQGPISIDSSKAPLEWTGRCFAHNSAVAAAQPDGTFKVSITTKGPSSSCSEDTYNFMTVTGNQKVAIDQEGTFEFTWTLPDDIRDAEQWDLDTKGIRVFMYNTDTPTTMANVLETVGLFIPEFTHAVDPVSAARNVDFLNRYSQFGIEKRDPVSSVPPMEREVHSGDFFGVIRLDGTDPMICWASGTTTGHSTSALWIDGELYITESTITDSYWPTNGIQKTPYRQWLKQAEEASYNVVWAPLTKEYRLKYNETAAVQFFLDNEGFDYGYRNFIFGWIDTLYDNYPCVPLSDGSTVSVCLQWEYVEALFGYMDRVNEDMVDKLMNQAFNLRLGTQGLRLPEILQEAGNRGMDGRELPTLVEQDSWMYNTTRYGEPAVGRSMVCSTYVCSSWKAAGLFGDKEVNCGEHTPVDDYGLALFEDEYKQIMGRYTLDLNRYNIKKPYEHMAEDCATMAPDYEQKVDC
jgi:hypothetical protein